MDRGLTLYQVLPITCFWRSYVMLSVGTVKRPPRSFFYVLLFLIYGSIKGCGSAPVLFKCQISALKHFVSHWRVSIIWWCYVARCNGRDSTSISWESVYKISCSWVDVLNFYVLLFGVLYLAWCDFVMDLTKEQRQILCKVWEKCDRDPGNDYTIVWGRKHKPYTESPNSPRTEKKWDRWRAKSRAWPSSSVISRGLFTKNSSCQTVVSV
jgi:hypothetical protein